MTSSGQPDPTSGPQGAGVLVLSRRGPLVLSPAAPHPERAVGFNANELLPATNTALTPPIFGVTGFAWNVPDTPAPIWPQSVLPLPRRVASFRRTNGWRPQA
jgi:hypothetical protein